VRSPERVGDRRRRRRVVYSGHGGRTAGRRGHV
jgi:hypothetical protein